MKKIFIFLGVIVALILALFITYKVMLNPISTKDDIVTFVINKGDSKQVVVDNLKKADLIKNKYATLLYVILSGKKNLQAGTYELGRNLSTNEIIDALANGDVVVVKKPTVRVLFKEGLTVKNYMEILAENTDLKYEDIIKEINDKEFVKSLIKDYWFLTDDILDEKIYYALEGYLFPETYEFYKDTTLNQAVRKLLDQTNIKLEEYKKDIENSKYTVHEIFTMASIIEKEVKTYDERTKASQVIFKRLNSNMSLGMDTTSLYGVGKEVGTDTITTADLNNSNPYNTRLVTFIGLPVGPICNPSILSIKAVLNPADTDYLYFLADKQGVTHFAKTAAEFATLKNQYLR